MSTNEPIPQHEIVLDNFTDVINTFQISHPLWASSHPHSWIFRGQSLCKWKLLPSIFRKDICDKYGIKPFEKRMLSTFIEAEFELIYDFTLLCDSVGLQLPEQAYTYIMNPEIRQFEPINDNYKKFPSIELQLILSLAQHHGIPTRLLDFTYDPLTALYFAAEKPEESLEGNEFLVVYALNRSNISNFIGRYKEIHTPSYANENLKHQKGLFLLDREANIDLEKGQFQTDVEDVLKISFEKLLERDRDSLTKIDNNQYFYRKIKIPEKLRMIILQHLHKSNYNRAHLLPSYESVAKTIRMLPHLQPPRWRKQVGEYKI